MTITLGFEASLRLLRAACAAGLLLALSHCADDDTSTPPLRDAELPIPATDAALQRDAEAGLDAAFPPQDAARDAAKDIDANVPSDAGVDGEALADTGILTDAAPTDRDASTIERDASTIERDASTTERDASTTDGDASRTDASTTERDASAADAGGSDAGPLPESATLLCSQPPVAGASDLAAVFTGAPGDVPLLQRGNSLSPCAGTSSTVGAGEGTLVSALYGPGGTLYTLRVTASNEVTLYKVGVGGWTKTVGSSATSADLSLGTAGEAFVAFGNGSVAKFDAAGTVAWSVIAESRNNDSGWSTGVAAGGYPVFIRALADGSSIAAFGSYLLKVDSNGDEVWRAVAPTDPATLGSLQRPTNFHVTAAGQAYLAGWATAEPGDAYLLHVAADGTPGSALRVAYSGVNYPSSWGGLTGGLKIAFAAERLLIIASDTRNRSDGLPGFEQPRFFVNYYNLLGTFERVVTYRTMSTITFGYNLVDCEVQSNGNVFCGVWTAGPSSSVQGFVLPYKALP